MNAIELTDVTKKFGELKALDSVTLKIPRGLIFGFLGPNGAGKSTAIRCILGAIYPSAGTVTVAGEPVTKNTHNYRSKIGYVPADDHLEKNWDGDKHIEFLSKALSINADPAPLIKRLGINTKKKVKELSTGNKQKLAILLALISEPEILIMDEPTRGLDPLLQEEVYSLIHELKEQGKTIFFSSHILSEVERLCDRVAIIREGKLVADESMSAIKRLQVHKVSVSFEKDSALPDLSDLGSIKSVTEQQILIDIQGDINPLIRRLSEYNIHDLNIGHASLEDSFLHYYEGK